MSKTFADIAKTIRKRFEGRENDPAAMRTMEAQMTKLMEANEMAKSQKEELESELHEEARRFGGSIKYAKGGRLVIDKNAKSEVIEAAKAKNMGMMAYTKELDRVAKLRCGGKMMENGGTLGQRYFADGGPWHPFTDVNDVYLTAESNFGTAQADYLKQNGMLEGFLNRDDLNFDSFKTETNSMSQGFIRPDERRVSQADMVSRGQVTLPLGPTSNAGAFSQVGSAQNIPVDPPQLPPSPTGNTGGGSSKRTPYQATAAELNEMSARFPSGNDRLESKVVRKDVPMGTNTDPANTVYSSKSAANAAQRKYNLPDTPEYTTKSAGDSGAPAGTDKSMGAGAGGGGGTNWGAITSAVPYIADMITASDIDKTKLERLDLKEVNLSKERELMRRDSAIGRLMARRAVRQNANSSGQAISALASQNAAITDSQIKGDLQSYLAEEKANTQIRNQEEIANQQISTQETIINEQNKGAAQTNMSNSAHGLSQTIQGARRDEKLTTENLRYNQTAIQIMNSMTPNYQWGTDPETEAWVLQYVNNNPNA